METVIKQDSTIRSVSKWSGFLIIAALCFSTGKFIHDKRMQELKVESLILIEKSALVTEMHRQMLAITRTQFQILHAGSHQEARQLLWQMSDQISDCLLKFHQLEKIADITDTELLAKFRDGFDQWHHFNQNLLNYANVIADSGFINTLGMVNLALSQFDYDIDDKQFVLTQLKRDAGKGKDLTN